MSVATLKPKKIKKPFILNPIPTVSGADLPFEDGEPLESEWHVHSINMLIHLLRHHTEHRNDVYVAGNMFVYFDPNQDKTKNDSFSLLEYSGFARRKIRGLGGI